jgi:hypothetical protein
MSHIEVGGATANAKIGSVANQSADDGIGNAGNVVNGSGESVIETELQISGEIFLNGYQQTVVARRTEIADVSVCRKLAGQTGVVENEAVGVESLKSIGQIALDDEAGEHIGDELRATSETLIFEPGLGSYGGRAVPDLLTQGIEGRE